MSGERLSGISFMPEYRVWLNMIQRCCNVNNPSFPDYGGRGITVCDSWKSSFENFFSDMGPRSSPEHSIERRDVNGHYEPGNCYWATTAEQARNKTNSVLLEYGGQLLTATEVGRMEGIDGQVIADRLRRGHSVETALSKTPPPRQRTAQLFELDGVSRPLKDWAREAGLSYETLYGRVVVKGLDLKTALAQPLKPQRKLGQDEVK